MSSTTGIQVIGNYAGAANDPARVQLLLDLLPNPDTTSSSGASAPGAPGANTYLDEISNAAVIQLRVELTAMKAAVS